MDDPNIIQLHTTCRKNNQLGLPQLPFPVISLEPFLGRSQVGTEVIVK